MVLALALALAASASGPVAWEPVPLVTAEMRARGLRGGEGGQWPRGMAISPDGRTLFLAIDVAGIYRSRDGGQNWDLTTVGFKARGCAAVAIDPRNPSRVIAVGANSSPAPQNGLYLSEDGGNSWRQTYSASLSGLGELRDQFYWDPSSFDPAKGHTRRAVWARVERDEAAWGTPAQNPILYASEDGGETWSEVAGTRDLAGSILRGHPSGDGRFYAANERGLYLASDSGRTFRKLADGPVTGVDVSAKLVRSVWISRPNGVFRSEDEGATWTELELGSARRPGYTVRNVRVSPADPRRILFWAQQNDGWDWPRFASHDGGRTWSEAKKDARDAFLPDNARQGVFVWHPSRPELAFSLGGDWPTRSTDGGKTWGYAGQGYNAILVGGRWSFCLNSPDVVFVASQDYNGAITEDGGRTWRYTNVSGNGWRGFAYGGYAVDRRFLIAGEATGWSAPRKLRMSLDGGRTWQDTGVALGGLDAGYGWPGSSAVAFASNFRTEDRGKSWVRMDGCDGVLAHTATPKAAVFGVKGKAVVRSADQGRTWQEVARHSDEVKDLAFDPRRNRLYAVAGERAWVFRDSRWEPLPIRADHAGNHRVRSVAVDPLDPSVVVVGSAAHVYSSDVSVQRSTDAGATFETLTRSQPLAAGARDGGREAETVRVHPVTRELWVSTSCYGIWKTPAPGRVPK